MNVETFKYDNRIVSAFAIATVVWGIVGMSAGAGAFKIFSPFTTDLVIDVSGYFAP